MKKKIFFGCFLLMVRTALSAQTISINIISPTEYQIVDSTLQISAGIYSSNQISTVVASADNHQIQLVLNAQNGRYEGRLSLSGLNQDTVVFQITVTDIQSNVKSLSEKIIYDLKPVIIVADSASFNMCVATPLVHVKAKCSDNTSCTILITATMNGGKIVSIGPYKDSVDIMADLSAVDGNWGIIAVTAKDSRGQQTLGTGGTVYVESSPYLKPIFAEKDEILDFNYDKVFVSRHNPFTLPTLYVNRIIDTKTFDSTLVPYTSSIGQIFLHPGGAIFGIAGPGIEDWNQGVLYNLGTMDGTSSLEAAGNYAFWSTINKPWLRNLSTKTNTALANTTGNINNDVAANGTAVYWNNAYNIVQYQNNNTTVITDNSGNKWNTYPLTDGTNVIYRKSDPCCGTQNYSLYFFDGQAHSDLSHLGTINPNPGENYQIINKYAAYSKPDSLGHLQIWLRDTMGNKTQITFYNNDSKIEKLGPFGDFSFTRYNSFNTLRRFFAYAKTGQIKDIGSALLGKVYYRDTTWYLTMGKTLYRIDLNIPPNNLNNSNVSIQKDSVYKYKKSDFAYNFTGPGQLMMVKIISTPKNGVLKLNNSVISVNTEISRINLDSLKFLPNPGFIGKDTVIWNGSNGIEYTSTPALIRMNVFAAPVLPQIATIKNNYCSGSGVQKIRIINFPDTSGGVAVIAKIDSTTLAISPDNSFSINIDSISTGGHTVKLTYKNVVGENTAAVGFNVIQSSTPDVGLSTNITNVVKLTDPVIITATNASGGGTTPKYTFAKDRLISNVLQAEGTSNTLSIQPNSLAVGANWVYVKMKTSDTCYTTQTNIDSIKIDRSAVTGITDIDFPAQQINVYPNPFSHTFTVSGLNTGKIYTIILTGTSGQQVFSQQTNNTKSVIIQKNGLSNGRYLLSIYDTRKQKLIGTLPILKQ